jgi:hypothetical protein
MTRRVFLWATLLLVPWPIAFGQERFTLEQVLIAPFATGLVAAPNGEKVAWIQQAEGVRNIWIAEGPAYEGRQLTPYDEDDGQDIAPGSLGFTRDNQNLVYVRGSTANPTNAPDSPMAQSLWIIATDGGGGP